MPNYCGFCEKELTGNIRKVYCNKTCKKDFEAKQAKEKREYAVAIREWEPRICNKKAPKRRLYHWWRGGDLNFRPSGYEPDELPDCSTPRYIHSIHLKGLLFLLF